MPLWTKDDSAAGAPKYKIKDNSPAKGAALFGTEVVGLGDGEYNNKKNHTGWTRVRRGKGPLVSFTITAPGTGYANTDTINVTGGTTNATATIGTNGTGVITSVTVTNAGSGFTNVSSTTVTITTGAGTGATLTPVLGGRAGRVQTETLVALSGMTSNNSTLA